MIVSVKITKKNNDTFKTDDYLFKSDTVGRAVEYILKGYEGPERVERIEAYRVDIMDITGIEANGEDIVVKPDIKLPDISIPYIPYTPNITTPYDPYQVTCGGK